ncbi:MAG TPA: porin family protein [Candidatus Polarisedimenticolia bacterium]|nr:porin family protein [Candidatus Polarisedimenticolia bacterium]
MTRKILLIVPLALALLFGSVDRLAAQSRPRPKPQPFQEGFGFSTMFVYSSFEDRVEISNDVGFSGRFGYYFTPHHEAEALFNWVGTEDAVFPYIYIDTFHFQFAYVYNFRPAGVVPYLTAGIGFLDVSDDALGSETDLTLGAGGGIRFFVTPVFNFRLEYRFNRFEGDGQVFAGGEDFDFDEFSFGVGWRFPSY